METRLLTFFLVPFHYCSIISSFNVGILLDTSLIQLPTTEGISFRAAAYKPQVLLPWCI